MKTVLEFVKTKKFIFSAIGAVAIAATAIGVILVQKGEDPLAGNEGVPELDA